MSARKSDDVGGAAPQLPPDEPVTSLDTAAPGVLTSKVTVKDEGANPEPRLEHFRSRIEVALRKSVEGIVEAGRSLTEAKEELGVSYTDLVDKLPISSSTATYLTKIAAHPVLSNPDYWAKLPSSYNTLYQLASIDESTLIEHIESGRVTPETTLFEAKALRTVGNFQPRDGEETDDGVIALTLAIPNVEHRRELFEKLHQLLRDYDGTVRDTQEDGAMAEWYREKVRQHALNKIEETKADLGKYTLDDLRTLEAGARALAGIKGRGARVPADYEGYASLSELVGEEEITRGTFRQWCKVNKMPCQLADLSRVQHEVYVYEQARLVAEREDEDGALKRLKRIASVADNTAMKKLATDLLGMLSDFVPKAARMQKAVAQEEEQLVAA